MHLKRIHLVAGLLILASSMAHGDTLQMPVAEESRDATVTTMDMPVRGLSMQQVESRYGSPLEKLSAVGEPPITRWIYADYTVYFEHQLVIHSVAKKR